MSKCVTSERCCEIWNLIHEEAAAALVERGGGLLQAVLKGNPRLLKMPLLATGRRARAYQSGRCLGLANAKTKRADVSEWILSGRQR